MSSEEVSSIAFCHTAQDAKDQGFAFPLSLGNKANSAPCLVFRLLTNAAGVVEDHVRTGVPGHDFVSKALKLARDQLAVELVHLTAECFQIDRGLVLHEACSESAILRATVFGWNRVGGSPQYFDFQG